MAYNSTADPFTDVNFLRLKIGDTHATKIAFTDAELGAMITRFTSGGVIKWNVCLAWCLRALAASPARLWTLKDAMGAGVSVTDMMDLIWARAEAAFTN